jgi:hypothetical protein
MKLHICLFDLECWRDHWRYGMPMRVYYKGKFWTVPFLSGNWLTPRRWDLENPIIRDSSPED